MKEILLAGAMVFGAGAVPVEAQSPSPTPIYEASPTPTVEPSPTPEPSQTREVEKLDVSALINYVNKYVNTDIDPKFFRRMERKAQNRPNEFFTKQEIPGGFVESYYPDGLGTPASPDLSLGGEVKVAYLHAVTNGVGNDYNGVPAGLNFFQTDDEIRLQLGEDGELASASNINLFNFDDLERFTLKNFKEPRALKDVEWTRVQANPQHFAYTYREFKDDVNHNILLATQTGFMVLANIVTEIPVVGTDQVPASPDPSLGGPSPTPTV